jgi:hypothetical protein
LVCPFKKIRIVINEIIEKADDKIMISRRQKSILATETSKYVANINNISNNTSDKMYL